MNDTASRPKAKPYWLILKVGVKVYSLGVPTEDFELIDTDRTGLVTQKQLDLSTVQQSVLIVFTLEDNLGLLFPDNPQESIGLTHHTGATCPTAPSNSSAGMFLREGLSMNRRTLAVMNRNPGSGHHYQFTLFMATASGAIVAACDPRIINN